MHNSVNPELGDSSARQDLSGDSVPRPSLIVRLYPGLAAAAIVAVDAVAWARDGAAATKVLAAVSLCHAPIVWFLVSLARTPEAQRPRWELARRFPWLTSKPERVSTNPADYLVALACLVVVLPIWIGMRSNAAAAHQGGSAHPDLGRGPRFHCQRSTS